jgi:hypothetical protein
VQDFRSLNTLQSSDVQPVHNTGSRSSGVRQRSWSVATLAGKPERNRGKDSQEKYMHEQPVFAPVRVTYPIAGICLKNSTAISSSEHVIILLHALYCIMLKQQVEIVSMERSDAEDAGTKLDGAMSVR